MPSDFNSELREGEDPVSVFSVNYSQQNQNIFKSISLDQSEYSETEESLKIVQDISMQGFENKPTPGGQNLYNVYAVRSYNAEVEMLGNAMIQPMMYFQLNNIPMFHGAYMITRVKHNIKPNHMSTTFTGVRIRAVESPIIDIADAYMNLIDTLDLSEAGTSTRARASVSGSFPPIVRTIIENGGSNGNVETGNINLVEIPEIKGVKISKSIPKERKKMITEAKNSLVEMLEAFVTFAKEQSYPTIENSYIGITSLYRSYDYQKFLYDKSKKDGSVALPGTSNHSWGIAVDLLFVPQKDGKFLNKKSFAPIKVAAKKEGFSFEYNPSLKWFLDNSYKFGFIIPETLRDGVDIDEYWHFEYHGTSAKCLYNKLPTTYGNTTKIDDNYKPVVKNPKGVDGNEAIYTEADCNFKVIKTGGDSSIEDLKFTKDFCKSKFLDQTLRLSTPKVFKLSFL
jgi:LAS superfamily LD-carboxypeptidase LdcB